jgi:hypothetical protein
LTEKLPYKSANFQFLKCNPPAPVGDQPVPEPRGAAAFPLPAVSAADHRADDRQIGTGNPRNDLCPGLGGADLAVAAKPPDHIFSSFGGQAVGVETAVEIYADYNPRGSLGDRRQCRHRPTKNYPRSAAEEPMVCMTPRWRGMDSKFQFGDASPLANSVGAFIRR